MPTVTPAEVDYSTPDGAVALARLLGKLVIVRADGNGGPRLALWATGILAVIAEDTITLHPPFVGHDDEDEEEIRRDGISALYVAALVS